MAGNFEEELKAEAEALRTLRIRQDEFRAEQRTRADAEGIEGLELPQVQALIAMRFETALLRNRLNEAERRLADLEHAVARAR